MEYEATRAGRLFSKNLFGALYRLEVLAAVNEAEVFNLKDLSERLGQPPAVSSVQKELKILRDAGLLQEQPPVGGMREVYYVAERSPLWTCARQLQAEAEASVQPQPLR